MKLKKGQRIATCRECGAQGIEDANDPAPGQCPSCFEKELAAFTISLAIANGMTEDEALAIVASVRDEIRTEGLL